MCRIVHWRLKHLFSIHSLHVSSCPSAAGSCLKKINPHLKYLIINKIKKSAPVWARASLLARRVVKKVTIVEIFGQIHRCRLFFCSSKKIFFFKNFLFFFFFIFFFALLCSPFFFITCFTSGVECFLNARWGLQKKSAATALAGVLSVRTVVSKLRTSK